MSVITEEKTGIINLFYDSDNGVIMESITNASRDFNHPSAQFEFIVGDSVSYTLITLPNGRTITKDVRK